MALISLDVFDTAIFRKVFKPTDIFCVVEDEVGHNFYNLRIEAQNKARKVSIFYNIFDIYKYIPQFDLKEEIKAEYSNCYANPYILEMYNNSKDEFIFISDMYLPEKVIVGMLERCGYKNPKVFVSCDYKAVKGDGKLFKVVEEVLGRKIDKHIGDNYSCDILGAKKAQINETEYVGPAIYNKEVLTPELENKKLRKLLIDEELSNNDIAEKIGYLFAPLILAFTRSVLDEAKDDQTIFFNARDGFLMYVVARWILKTKKKIKYCRFSRKSCFLPNLIINKALKDPSNAETLKFLKIQRIKTLRDFLRMYKLNENLNYNPVLNKYSITLDTIIELHNRRTSIIEDTLLLVQSDLYKVAMKSREGFLKYINKIGMKNGDIWVDIGYTGTMQGIIKRVASIDLHGRYVVTKGNPNGLFQGLKFERKSFLPENFINEYSGAIMEFVFTEARGTVVDYSEGGTPIFLEDLKFRKDITKKLIRGVIKGIKDLIKEQVNISKKDCISVLKRYWDYPTIEEAEFSNKPIFENGSYRENESIVWYNRDYIKKGKIKECYNRSYWRNAFKVLLNNDPNYKILSKYIM